MRRSTVFLLLTTAQITYSQCPLTLPTPQLALVSKQDIPDPVQPMVKFTVKVTNASAFPAEIFAPVTDYPPEFPPEYPYCGNGSSSAIAYLYSSFGDYFISCSIRSANDLNSLSVTGPRDLYESASAASSAFLALFIYERKCYSVAFSEYLDVSNGGCTFDVSPAAISAPATGFTGAIATLRASAPTCQWTATSSVPWITFTGSASGTGDASILVNIAPNTGPSSRTGTLVIGGQTRVVTQPSLSTVCTYSLPKSSQTFPSTGGVGQAAITAPPGCPWSASSNAAWLVITPGTGSGISNGAVSFTALPNTGTDARSATLTIADQIFIVVEAGASSVSCATGAATTTTIHSEGRTEAAADFLLVCAGTPSSPLTADVVLVANTNITTRVVDANTEATDAILYVNNPQAPQFGVNAFRGIVEGYDTLRFPNVPMGPNTLRITGLLVDAAQLTSAQAGSVFASVSIQGRLPVALTGGPQTLASARAGVLVQRGASTPGPNPATQTILPVTFQEGFPTSFRVTANPNQDRLLVKFTSVPANVTIYAPVTSDNGSAQLFSADANGAGGSAVAGSPRASGIYAAVTLTNGTGTATWAITSASAQQIESIVFSILIENASTANLNAIKITGGLAPFSDVVVASATAPIPRFRDLSRAITSVNLRAETQQQFGSTSPSPSRPVQRAPVGSNVTFLHQILNDSETSATNVIVRNNLPSTLALVSCAGPTGAACGGTGSELKATLPMLPPGQKGTMTVVAQVLPTAPSGSLVDNSVTVASDLTDIDLASNTASSSFLVGPCTFGLTKLSATVAASGDLGRVDVQTATGCGWSASSNVQWITVSPNGPAIGPSPVRYTVMANPGTASRTGVLSIAGQAFSVTQAGNACTFAVAVSSSTIPPAGGTFNLTVTTGAACDWIAAANPGWITFPTAPAGAGSGTMSFSVAANTATTPRTGTIVVDGQVAQIVQQRSNTPPPTPTFADVPLTHPYFDQTTLLKQFGITSGCTAANYCPDSATTRGQMAVFIIRSLFGGDVFPFPATPYFTDVPATHVYFKFIQKMRELGITSGCTATQYCPDDSVTRGQMAVFLIRGRLGISASQTFPYPATPYFTDVPATHPYFSFIQKMRELSITTGCTTTNYCADDATTRGQMAVFLVRAFFTP